MSTIGVSPSSPVFLANDLHTYHGQIHPMILDKALVLLYFNYLR